MAADDLFKRYLEVGAAMLGMSRERAETIVRDLVASGEVARGQATKAADWLVERGRTGSEELAEMIRREIRQQVTAMGLATQDDIARLEARLEEATAAAAGPMTPGAGTAGGAAAPARKRAAPTAPRRAPGPAAAKKAATPGDAAATPPLPKAAEAPPQRTAKKTRGAPGAGTAGGRTGAGTAGGRTGAGITRSGSVAKRSGPRRAAPPTGTAAPPKG